ncbi:hypothetical protein AVEN_114125-1 [Araneus ventricosus]|uniref:Uncharacterized protein n=1 Tax=Araneus ventricosus TaxID=182803 RepID=A0A4Y2Q639_ARAVE|nr:hypothetical protein AVEN_114125-1 [Araneus ventricosus]
MNFMPGDEVIGDSFQPFLFEVWRWLRHRPRHCEGTLHGIVKCRANSATTAMIASSEVLSNFIGEIREWGWHRAGITLSGSSTEEESVLVLIICEWVQVVVGEELIISHRGSISAKWVAIKTATRFTDKLDILELEKEKVINCMEMNQMVCGDWNSDLTEVGMKNAGV